MEPLSSLAITTLAFISLKASETVIEKFTETALTKANELREKIWHKLQGNSAAKKALQAAQDGSETDLEAVADYLKIAMREDPEFAEEIKVLAEEIEAEKIEDQSVWKMIIRDQGTGSQIENRNTGGENYSGNITINKIDKQY
ncbi:hypothetical protein Xen7305DRAFT_00042430 [Xenococcus sp. PCC 7305]|uniref:hypothetical protein n=1 Tax=Xenococcus sp. PCC 7305 TaxID=102125 RepID=UPI0002ABBF04|nr:hypothetical protein [Xenococcus sp. PCC 7305]ELS04509.1 hypothetical protein Xen7305DRAFT_00042430 [Xenococcus sp. PCC 7305]